MYGKISNASKHGGITVGYKGSVVYRRVLIVSNVSVFHYTILIDRGM